MPYDILGVSSSVSRNEALDLLIICNIALMFSSSKDLLHRGCWFHRPLKENCTLSIHKIHLKQYVSSLHFIESYMSNKKMKCRSEMMPSLKVSHKASHKNAS